MYLYRHYSLEVIEYLHALFLPVTTLLIGLNFYIYINIAHFKTTYISDYYYYLLLSFFLNISCMLSAVACMFSTC